MIGSGIQHLRPPAVAIPDDAVTNAKLADMATARIKGRATAGTGNPEDLTATQATALLDTVTPALKGLAPASGGGTANFLRADCNWAAPSPFSAEYTSSQQTITSAGSLTLAHGLSARPKLIQATLVCTTAENGYSIGDELVLDGFFSTTNATLNRGFSAVVDATNINIRFGSSPTTFGHLNKTTGAFVAFTNANWRFVIRAWA